MSGVNQPYNARIPLPTQYDPAYFKAEHQNIQRAIAGAQSDLNVVVPSTLTTSGIQTAVNKAQAFVPQNNVYSPRAPWVLLPDGDYDHTGTVEINRPILVAGQSEYSCRINASGVNKPAFLINLLQAQSTYIRFGLCNMTIVGRNSPATYVTQDLSDGVKVTGIADVTPFISRLRIIGMTGNGVHLHDKNNSPAVVECVIEICSKAGIRANGTFCTNAMILWNIVRENRMGLQYKSDAGTYLSSGRVLGNTFESNNGRTSGTLGTADMPSVGIWLYRTSRLEFAFNYCENQANDLFMEGGVSGCIGHHNQWLLGNSWDLATTYGPPAFQMGHYVGFAPDTCTNNDFDSNIYYNQPAKPAACSDAKWNTAGFGTTYGHVTDTQGVNRYRYNNTSDPLNGQVIIDQGAAIRHLVLNAQQLASDPSGRSEAWRQAFSARDTFPRHETIDNDTGVHTFRHLGATNDVYKSNQFGSFSRTLKIHERSTDGTTPKDIGQLNPNGREFMVWDDASANTFYEGWASTFPAAGGRPAAAGGGNWLVGDRLYNTAPVSGGFAGWICTTAGSPGTWKTFGAIS